MYLWFQKQLLLDSLYSGSFFLGFWSFPRGLRVRVWFVVVVGGLRDVNEVLVFCGGIMDAEVVKRKREMACTVEG
jgi:hypothetical protein